MSAKKGVGVLQARLGGAAGGGTSPYIVGQSEFFQPLCEADVDPDLGKGICMDMFFERRSKLPIAG